MISGRSALCRRDRTRSAGDWASADTDGCPTGDGEVCWGWVIGCHPSGPTPRQGGRGGPTDLTSLQHRQPAVRTMYTLPG
jgi:hypothetical protein